MEVLKIALLGFIQGITELLPISSTGHLILIGKFLEIPTTTLLLSVLHLGTTIAIIFFFRKELFKKFFTKEKFNFYLKIIISSIPAGVTGILLEEMIDEKLHDTWIIAVSLIFWGIIMIAMERKKKVSETDIEHVSWKQSLTMGFGQVFALIPGTSRSGVTTVAGMLSGLDKYTSLEYSFLLGIPVLLGGSMYEIAKNILSLEEPIVGFDIFTTIVRIGAVVIIPMIVSYIALLLLQRFKKKNWLTLFGVYRIVLGILILIVL